MSSVGVRGQFYSVTIYTACVQTQCYPLQLQIIYTCSIYRQSVVVFLLFLKWILILASILCSIVDDVMCVYTCMYMLGVLCCFALLFV